MNICIINYCDNKKHSRQGWCEKHYKRWLIHGDPNKCNKFSESHNSYVKNRFYSYVTIPNKNGCMEWTGAKHNSGYGTFSLKGSVLIKAHRYSYELFKGKFNSDMHVLHQCDNPKCVAPNHLYLGKDKENARDRIERNRHSNPPIRIGEKNNKSKLNESNVVEIINLLEQKFSERFIANKFGVTKNSIHSIKHGKTWANISRSVRK